MAFDNSKPEGKKRQGGNARWQSPKQGPGATRQGKGGKHPKGPKQGSDYAKARAEGGRNFSDRRTPQAETQNRFGPKSLYKSFSSPSFQQDGRVSYAPKSGRSFKPNYESAGQRGSQSKFGRNDYSKGRPQFTPAERRFGPDSFGQSTPTPRPEAANPARFQGETTLESAGMDLDLAHVNLLTGRNPIREAIRSGRDLEKLMISKGELSGSAREIVSMAKKAGIMIQSVERSRLDQLAKNHQGMVAFASAYQYAKVEDMLQLAKERGEAPFLILLDQLTDPHNLGAIIRTALCAGAHGVIVPLHRAVGLTPAAVKASSGAVEHMKVARVTNLNQTIKSLQKQGIWFFAAQTEGEDYRSVSFDGPCGLVIGSEGEGISKHTGEICDKQIKIPMAGEIGSLNASVAAGILMYAVYGSRNQI